MKIERTCCIFGHRVIRESEELKARLRDTIEKMIVSEKVEPFLFGSKSQFNDLCLDLVSKIKEKYPHVKRIYVRAEYPHIGTEYEKYLLERYDDTYFPSKICNAGRSVYVERNFEMIDHSRFCIVYYDEQNAPLRRKSGNQEKEMLSLFRRFSTADTRLCRAEWRWQSPGIKESCIPNLRKLIKGNQGCGANKGKNRISTKTDPVGLSGGMAGRRDVGPYTAGASPRPTMCPGF